MFNHNHNNYLNNENEAFQAIITYLNSIMNNPDLSNDFIDEIIYRTIDFLIYLRDESNTNNSYINPKNGQ